MNCVLVKIKVVETRVKVGDSEGPYFVALDSGKKVLIGVVSSGMGCARRNKPDVCIAMHKVWQCIKEKVPKAKFSKTNIYWDNII
eukprot:Pgem_evm1s14873